MSAVVKRAMLASAGLRPNERLVLVAVAAHMDVEGQNAFPSVDTIAELAGVARRTVQRALARLVELGKLVINRSRGRRTNVYELPRQPDDAVNRATDHEPTVSSGPATASSARPTVPPKVTPEVEDHQEVGRRPAHGWGWPSATRALRAVRGAAALPAPKAGQCPRHRGSPARNCGPCRSERIGVAA